MELPQRPLLPGYLVEVPPRRLPESPAITLGLEWTGVVFPLAVSATRGKVVHICGQPWGQFESTFD